MPSCPTTLFGKRSKTQAASLPNVSHCGRVAILASPRKIDFKWKDNYQRRGPKCSRRQVFSLDVWRTVPNTCLRAIFALCVVWSKGLLASRKHNKQKRTHVDIFMMLSHSVSLCLISYHFIRVSHCFSFCPEVTKPISSFLIISNAFSFAS